ncbi:hypothetical protein BDV98DRAFT_53926 [Pterulicium gracile]|uniref:Uncharacterized protein n=1 Tax=Pterulicium gracile TaxID=1884261 RepID=A0A5C3QLE9_9AGAR|nr:hypothetical protein BDV98DRAFT_53926 [Pterula gracilis]
MHNEAAAFDASDFRRSAMLLNDPPTHADILAQGYGSGSSTGPRPPSMFQHRIASPAPTFGTQYGLPAPAMAYAQDTTSPVSYGINGQNYPAPYSPYTPSSADHLAAGTYSPSPYSPGFGDSQSMNHNSYQSNIASSRAGDHESYGRSDQVDLERSSVSPYQATQYAEISRQLDTEVPQGLNTPAVQEYMHQSNTAYGAPVAVAAASSIPPAYMSRPSSPSYTVPAEKLPSPFEDSDRNSYPREKETQSNPLAPIASHDTVQSFGAVPHLEFPAPPALDQANQHNRVDSTPPILPEISVSRDSYGFPAPVITHHSEGNNGTLHAGHQFPTTPSPLKSTFSHEAIADSAPAPAASATRAQEKPAAKRPDTVYDEGDVYGGI